MVKESDSKSDGLCPHRFESCSSRIFFSSNSKSAFYRSHVIAEFFQSATNKGLSLDSVSNESGSYLFDTLKTMAIVDYVFFCCSFDYVEVLILTLNGTLVLIQFNLEEQERESLYRIYAT